MSGQALLACRFREVNARHRIRSMATPLRLDEGESIGALLAQGGPPTPALAHLDIDKQGRERRGHSPGRRAAVRQADGRHHHRDPVGPRRDGLPSRRRDPAHPDRGPVRPGRAVTAGGPAGLGGGGATVRRRRDADLPSAVTVRAVSHYGGRSPMTALPGWMDLRRLAPRRRGPPSAPLRPGGGGHVTGLGDHRPDRQASRVRSSRNPPLLATRE
jgi:hypothetical protein